MKALLFTLLVPIFAHASFVIPPGTITLDKFAPQVSSPSQISNCTIATTVSANALTISLKDNAGAAPSAFTPCKVVYRNSTAATGSYTAVTTTSALSLVISSGSTLGCQNNAECDLYIYAINSGSGTVLGVINAYQFDEGALQSSGAEGGGGGADSVRVLYSTAAQTNKPVRLLARVEITETTAGTWVTNASNITPYTANPLLTTDILTGQMVLNATSIHCAGSSSVSQTGDWISSIGNITSGVCTVSVRAGVFSISPHCTGNPDQTNGNALVQVTVDSATSIRMHCSASGSNCSNWDGQLICVGQR